jgi:mannosyltransferase OCH1-like enzyme/GT2 family glycosyltransferase
MEQAYEVLDDLGFANSINNISNSGFDNHELNSFEIGLVVATWNRFEYLSKSLASLSKSRLNNCLLVIIDDASDDKDVRRLIQETAFDVPVIKLFKSSRTNVNVSLDIAWSFLNKIGCKKLVNLDSDTLVKTNWLEVLNQLHDKLRYRKDRLVLSGFNRHNNPSVISDNGDHIVKSAMGGINYYFDSSMFNDFVKPFLSYQYWDSELQDYFLKHRAHQFKMVSAKPSVVQHIGVNGLNSNGVYDYASDFDEGELGDDGVEQINVEIDTKKCSCLITFRDSDEARLDNLYYVVNHLAQHPDFEIIIVEQSASALIDKARLSENTIYKFVHNSAEFNKSWGINIAASLSSADIFIVHDADMVLDLSTLQEAVDQFERGIEAVNPFDLLIDLNSEETESFLLGDKEVDISRSESEINRIYQGQIPPFCGGVFLISSNVFYAIGGMDERFSGWGAEDDAVSLRLFNQTSKIQIFEQKIAYHLHHEKKSGAPNTASASYVRNLALLSAYHEQGSNLIDCFKADVDSNANPAKYSFEAVQPTHDDQPLISCLCVTRDRVEQLKRVIECFKNQTYTNKELLIVCDQDDLATLAFVAQLDDVDIRHHVVSTHEKKNLGQLRNLSIELSNGDYFCQWDDDDWYHPSRLSLQLEFCQKNQKSASVLPRWFIYSDVHDKAYLSNIRLWEGSVLCHKNAFDSSNIYSQSSRGEETPMIRHLLTKDELAVVDAPSLYLYWHGGGNTWDSAHFDAIFRASSLLDEKNTQAIKQKFIPNTSAEVNGSIPKIIHQTAKTKALSSQYQSWQKDVLEMHESWDYCFYDDSDCRKIISDNMPELLACYDALPLDIHRVDLFRLVVVYLNGGFYLDFDIVIKKPLDDLTKYQCVLAEEIVLTEQQALELNHKHASRIANYMFGAQPKDPFIAKLIEHIAANAPSYVVHTEDDVLESTGPAMLTKLYHSYDRKDQIKVLKNKENFCVKCGQLSCAFGDYASHMHEGSWRWDNQSPAITSDHSRLIHQTWKTTQIPSKLSEFVETWRVHHPNWKSHLWTDDDNRNLIATHYPWFLETYDNYPHNIQRADAARYFILFSLGGLYVDLDFKCIKPIDELLDGSELILGIESQAHADLHKKPYIVGNAFMYAAQPGSPFLRKVIEELVLTAPVLDDQNNYVLETTGPFMLSRVYEQYEDKSSIKLLPADKLYPIDYLEAEKLLNNKADDDAYIKNSSAYAIHYHYGSWWK